MHKAIGENKMDARLAQFVRGLYFDIQTIEGVRPLEIWNGVREKEDPFELTLLIKNLFKITVPLVNERCFGRPFPIHSARARDTVAALLSWFLGDPQERIFRRFPYPPTGEGDQKELYRVVKARADELLESIDAAQSEGQAPAKPPTLAQGVFPDGLFDFRELRLVDNELPYIIFTDKEFRVIHGLAIVYLWLIDLDAIFLATLGANGVDRAISEEYRQFGRHVQKENPLTIHGHKMDAHELVAHIHEMLKTEDYLDLFANVYAWFEQIRDKFIE
jgi:hypothetical protein